MLPCHACAHCRGFAPAAPRRARGLISVPFSGLPLSRPVLITDLVSRYLTNYLISRRVILRRRSFGSQNVPVFEAYMVLSSVSRGYPLPKGRFSTCY